MFFTNSYWEMLGIELEIVFLKSRCPANELMTLSLTLWMVVVIWGQSSCSPMSEYWQLLEDRVMLCVTLSKNQKDGNLNMKRNYGGQTLLIALSPFLFSFFGL